MTFAGSKLQMLPRPWQVSHAPNGLLKENDRGSGVLHKKEQLQYVDEKKTTS